MCGTDISEVRGKLLLFVELKGNNLKVDSTCEQEILRLDLYPLTFFLFFQLRRLRILYPWTPMASVIPMWQSKCTPTVLDEPRRKPKPYRKT